jgi:hypothetical protein
MWAATRSRRAGAVAVATVAVGTIGAVATGGSVGALGGLEDVVKDAFREDQLRHEQEQAADERERWETAQALMEAIHGNPMRLLGCVSTLALMVVMLPFMAIAGGGGGAGDVPAAKALPRVRWTPHVTLLGLLSGLLAGAGGTVLLQQYSIDYPTLSRIRPELVYAGPLAIVPPNAPIAETHTNSLSIWSIVVIPSMCSWSHSGNI